MRSTPRTTSVALVIATSVTLALSGCVSGDGGGGGGGGDQAGPTGGIDTENAKLVSNNPQDRGSLEQGGTLTLAVGDWTTNFNAMHVDGNGGEYARVINATDPWLYVWAPDGTMSPRPEYLRSMPRVEQRGGKEVVTYDLNPQAKWNDGTPIDHTAFAATWRARRAPVDEGGYNNVSTAGYEDIESVAQGAAPNEVVVTFARPFYPATEVFQTLVHPKLGASADAFNTLAKTDFRPELRAGPFTLESLDQTSKTIVLKPNPNWWGPAPLLGRVVFRQMEDSATIPAFTNGEIDVIDGPSGVANKARYAQIQGAPGLEIRRSQRTATTVYTLNGKADGLTDVAVRKAIWQSIDREEWKRVRFSGLEYSEKPVNSAVYFSFQPQAQDNMPVRFSTQEAKTTLEGAGYALGSDGIYAKGGQRLSVKYTYFGDDPLQTALAQTTQNQLKKAGIELQLDNRPAAAFGQTMEKRDYGFVAMAWSASSSHPLTSVCQTMCSDSGSNYSTLGTAELDARMRGLGQIADASEQARAINAVEKDWMAQTYGQLPIANGPVMAAYRQGIANLGPALFASMHPQWENVGWQQGSRHN